MEKVSRPFLHFKQYLHGVSLCLCVCVFRQKQLRYMESEILTCLLCILMKNPMAKIIHWRTWHFHRHGKKCKCTISHRTKSMKPSTYFSWFTRLNCRISIVVESKRQRKETPVSNMILCKTKKCNVISFSSPIFLLHFCCHQLWHCHRHPGRCCFCRFG